MSDGIRTCVGIDVAKATPDVHVRPTDAQWTVANDVAGIRTLVAQVATVAPALIVLLSRTILAALPELDTSGWSRPASRRR